MVCLFLTPPQSFRTRKTHFFHNEIDYGNYRQVGFINFISTTLIIIYNLFIDFLLI